MLSPTSKLRLVYVTPEKVVKSKRFLSKLEKVYADNRLSRVVIDEAHCCSQWGHVRVCLFQCRAAEFRFAGFSPRLQEVGHFAPTVSADADYRVDGDMHGSRER